MEQPHDHDVGTPCERRESLHVPTPDAEVHARQVDHDGRQRWKWVLRIFRQERDLKEGMEFLSCFARRECAR